MRENFVGGFHKKKKREETSPVGIGNEASFQLEQTLSRSVQWVWNGVGWGGVGWGVVGERVVSGYVSRSCGTQGGGTRRSVLLEGYGAAIFILTL